MARTAQAHAGESDDALMACVAARDADALRLLADRHAEIAWRIAYRMLNDAAEAEDVAQEAMLRLWQYADRWQAGGPGVAAWLTRVATNACLDRIRRRRFVGEDAIPEIHHRGLQHTPHQHKLPAGISGELRAGSQSNAAAYCGGATPCVEPPCPARAILFSQEQGARLQETIGQVVNALTVDG